MTQQVGGATVSKSPVNFVLQQGFRETSAASCDLQVPALMFQPRVIGLVVLVGLVFQAWPIFLGLSTILWWNVLVPSMNPFDAFFNLLIAGRKERPRLTPAPPPRRFAQGMAASFTLGIGLSILYGLSTLALVLEGFLILALGLLILGKFCLGSYVFHLVRGRIKFANRTLPWARGE
jgi:Domain of unknown function (DUF4395)